MKKFFIPLALFLMTVFIASPFILYKKGTRISCSETNNYTVDNINKITEKAENAAARLSILFIENGKEQSMTLEDLGINLAPHIPNPDNLIVYPGQITYTADRDEIYRAIENINRGRTPGKAGSLIITDDGIRMSEPKESTYIAVSDLTDKIYDWISSYRGLGQNTFKVVMKEYYNQYRMLPGEIKIQSEYEDYKNLRIEYTTGTVFDGDEFFRRGIIKLDNGHIKVIDEDEALPLIQEMLRQKLGGYNTVGDRYLFSTHDDDEIWVTSVTYGDYIDYEEESRQIYDIIEKSDNVRDRKPVMKQTSFGSINETYIEVDINAQHAYYYKDRELLWDSDIVTGKMTQDRKTHLGIYFIYNKVKDVHLEKWNADVERWMSVTYDGQGFHDASWRDEFGGSIYINNGSHGCINTPHDKMFELYDLVEIGTPVIIYQKD